MPGRTPHRDGKRRTLNVTVQYNYEYRCICVGSPEYIRDIRTKCGSLVFESLSPFAVFWPPREYNTAATIVRERFLANAYFRGERKRTLSLPNKTDTVCREEEKNEFYDFGS